MDFTPSMYNYGTADERLMFCVALFERGEPVHLGIVSWGVFYVADGFIDRVPKRCSGVWGYGGDSIAVYSDGKAYPSEAIVALNLWNW